MAFTVSNRNPPSFTEIMSFQYDFPSELLLAIFGEVLSYEDLLTLAATCRRFNHLSLQVFFSRHNFDPRSKTIILQCYHRPRSLEVIPALAMSLALRRTSLEHLTFDFGLSSNIRLPQEIRTLTRYTMNLSTIDRVTLHLVIPYYTLAMDWKAAYVALLEALIGKSCSNLHVETNLCFEIEDSLLISKTPSWSRIPGRIMEAVKKSNGEVKHLKDCFIQTFPTFLRPFYLRVLKANAPVLTSLAFKHIFGSITAIDWGFLITNIHLPVLKRFAVTSSVIPRDAIIKFLAKHSHLTNFEYHDIGYTSKSKGVPRRLKDVFKYLEQLTTTPEHIVTFLPTMDQMPCLTSVAIIIDDFTIIERALRGLSPCVRKVKLMLDISSIPTMFELVHFGSSFRGKDGFLLHCVESLHIRWGWQYKANDLGIISTWLEPFPELKQLSVTSSSRRLVGERNTIPRFFNHVKLACPTITSISLQGEPEWTYDN